MRVAIKNVKKFILINYNGINTECTSLEVILPRYLNQGVLYSKNQSQLEHSAAKFKRAKFLFMQ